MWWLRDVCSPLHLCSLPLTTTNVLRPFPRWNGFWSRKKRRFRKIRKHRTVDFEGKRKFGRGSEGLGGALMDYMCIIIQGIETRNRKWRFEKKGFERIGLFFFFLSTTLLVLSSEVDTDVLSLFSFCFFRRFRSLARRAGAVARDSTPSVPRAHSKQGWSLVPSLACHGPFYLRPARLGLGPGLVRAWAEFLMPEIFRAVIAHGSPRSLSNIYIDNILVILLN